MNNERGIVVHSPWMKLMGRHFKTALALPVHLRITAFFVLPLLFSEPGPDHSITGIYILADDILSLTKHGLLLQTNRDGNRDNDTLHSSFNPLWSIL